MLYGPTYLPMQDLSHALLNANVHNVQTNVFTRCHKKSIILNSSSISDTLPAPNNPHHPKPECTVAAKETNELEKISIFANLLPMLKTSQTKHQNHHFMRNPIVMYISLETNYLKP